MIKATKFNLKKKKQNKKKTQTPSTIDLITASTRRIQTEHKTSHPLQNQFDFTTN